MDIQTLKNFLVLAETLNFTRASEKIAIVQPALSRQIQLLEEEVGATLLKRTNRKVELTEAGFYFLKEINQILHRLEGVKNRTAEIHRGEAGEIKIGHSSSAMHSILPAILVKSKWLFPNLKTLLIEETNRLQVLMLLNRDIDIGFGPNLNTPAEIVKKMVYSENFSLILPENHPISTESYEGLAQFSEENFIIPPLHEGIGYVESLHQLCQNHGFTPKVIHETANSGSVLRLIEAGVGVTIEPTSTLNGYKLNVKSIELKNETIKAEMFLIYLKEREAELYSIFKVLET
jgi:DNA-binding transcriptional LysR family regulator